MSGDASLELPLVIMTSDDTHAPTLALLAAHGHFGLAPGQVTVLKQEKVPAMTDVTAKFAVREADPWEMDTKPHGHGDVHLLLQTHPDSPLHGWRKQLELERAEHAERRKRAKAAAAAKAPITTAADSLLQEEQEQQELELEESHTQEFKRSKHAAAHHAAPQHAPSGALSLSVPLVASKRRPAVRWLFFFQDTNALALNALLATLGAAVTQGLAMTTVCVPRRPGDAVGAICDLRRTRSAGTNGTDSADANPGSSSFSNSLVNPESKPSSPTNNTRAAVTATDAGASADVHAKTSALPDSLTVNVEYNVLGPLLGGHEVTLPDGTSPFPGNTNALIIALEPYCEVLARTGGVISEFVNPKYADASRSAFASPARLESMMQDLPLLLPATAKVGYCQFPRWLAFAPVKNATADAAARQAKGLEPETAASGEWDFYDCNRRLLRICCPRASIAAESEETVLASARAGAGASDSSSSAEQTRLYGCPARLGGVRVRRGAAVVLAPALGTALLQRMGAFKDADLDLGPRAAVVLDAAKLRVARLRVNGALRLTVTHPLSASESASVSASDGETGANGGDDGVEAASSTYSSSNSVGECVIVDCVMPPDVAPPIVWTQLADLPADWQDQVKSHARATIAGLSHNKHRGAISSAISVVAKAVTAVASAAAAAAATVAASNESVELAESADSGALSLSLSDSSLGAVVSSANINTNATPNTAASNNNNNNNNSANDLQAHADVLARYTIAAITARGYAPVFASRESNSSKTAGAAGWAHSSVLFDTTTLAQRRTAAASAAAAKARAAGATAAAEAAAAEGAGAAAVTFVGLGTEQGGLRGATGPVSAFAITSGSGGGSGSGSVTGVGVGAKAASVHGNDNEQKHQEKLVSSL